MRVPVGPVIACSAPFLGDEDVLGVVEIGVGPVLDGVDDLNSREKYPGLEVDEEGARHVMVIVGLIEEDIFPVFHCAVDCILFENA